MKANCISFFVLLLGCFACSKQVDEPAFSKILSEQNKYWESLAKQTFLNSDNHNKLSELVTVTESLFDEATEVMNNKVDNQNGFSATINMFDHHIGNVYSQKSEATIERLDALARMLIVHQTSSLGKTRFNITEQEFLSSETANNTEFKQFLSGLQNFTEQNPVFQRGDFGWYFVDEKTHVMAYQRRLENTRAYIAFNFSFDTVDMPFPFGFMNSTKITLWQSDTNIIESFVTKGRVSLRPYTVNIVIVG